MANIATTNPLQLDTAAAVTTSKLYIQSIIVVASADTWSCVLSDQNGNVVFRADSAMTNHRTVFWSVEYPIPVDGLTFTTKTNLTTVLVYTVDQKFLR